MDTRSDLVLRRLLSSQQQAAIRGHALRQSAEEIRSSMIAAAVNLRRRIEMLSDGHERTRLEAEYSRAIQYRALADNLLGNVEGLASTLDTIPVNDKQKGYSAGIGEV